MLVSAFTPNALGNRAGRRASRTPSKRLLAGVVALWLGSSSPVTAHAPEIRHSNWISPDAPCARYDDLKKAVLGDIGVRIDATGPWADEFRRALSFWNAVLAA